MTESDAQAAPDGRIASDERIAPDAQAAPDARAESDQQLLALIDRLTAILDRSDLAELEVEAGGTALVLRKAEALMQPVAFAPHRAHGTADAGHETPAPDPMPAAALPAAPAGPAPNAVVAPLTGIFYASPTPTSPAFVSVGQEIFAGQVIGLIEAMKLFNEIKSDKSGRVSRVVAENGALVKAKQPLIEVEPL